MTFYAKHSEFENDNRVIIDLTKKTLSMFELEDEIFFGQKSAFKSGNIEECFVLLPNAKNSIPKLVRLDQEDDDATEWYWNNKIEFDNQMFSNGKTKGKPRYWSPYSPLLEDDMFAQIPVECECRVFYPAKGMPLTMIKILFQSDSLVAAHIDMLHRKCEEFVQNANKNTIGGPGYITMKKDFIEALANDGIVYIAKDAEKTVSADKNNFSVADYVSPYKDKNIEFVEKSIQCPDYRKSDTGRDTLSFSTFTSQPKTKQYIPTAPVRIASFHDKKKPLFLGINPEMNSVLNMKKYFEYSEPIYGPKEPGFVSVYRFHGIPVFNTSQLVNDALVDGVPCKDYRGQDLPNGWYPDIELVHFLVLKQISHRDVPKAKNI